MHLLTDRKAGRQKFPLPVEKLVTFTGNVLIQNNKISAFVSKEQTGFITSLWVPMYISLPADILNVTKHAVAVTSPDGSRNRGVGHTNALCPNRRETCALGVSVKYVPPSHDGAPGWLLSVFL